MTFITILRGAVLVGLVLSAVGRAAEPPTTQPTHTIAAEPFKPTWESLASGYQCPDWFRDAKFTIWAHWSAQCVPERGDWYARRMYMQGDPDYDDHVARYGHPTKVGFMELEHLWTAAKWEPEKLMSLYEAAGAKYFSALANHHDNFDNYDSKYHAWKSLNVAPKRDIVGTWEKAARAAGLRFGVTNHSAHAWHWFQVAYGYDAEGPFACVRYDAATLTKADGNGKWWDGLDPQELYGGRTRLAPADGFTAKKPMQVWNDNHNGVFAWDENVNPENQAFAENWFLRCQDLIDKHHPDQIYFDDTGLPLDQEGLDITAHFYNSNMAHHVGKLERVMHF